MTRGRGGKIRGIGPTKGPGEVEKTKAVAEVERVKKAEAVGGVTEVGSVTKGKRTRKITMAERDELFRYISEEAEKLFGESGLPKDQHEIVADAVKMAVDSGLLEEEEGAPKKDQK